MKVFLRNLLFVLSVLSLTLALLCCILALLGYRPFILDSASMEPMYKKGSFVLADTRVSASDVEIGDVLIYRSGPGTLVMHRLVAEDTLMGDANQTTEHVVLDDANLIGRIAVSVESPALTFLVEHPAICWGLVIVFLILSCLPSSTAQSRGMLYSGDADERGSARREDLHERGSRRGAGDPD